MRQVRCCFLSRLQSAAVRLGLTMLLLLVACRAAPAEQPVPTLIPLALLPTQTVTPTAVPTIAITPATAVATPTQPTQPGTLASTTPTTTPTPSQTPIPSATPTSIPQGEPTLIVTEPLLREGVPTPATAVPTPVPTFAVERPGDYTNILLLGSDEPLGAGEKSDTIILVTVNRRLPTAVMLSIPRDLYVYIPGQSMGKINTASLYGVETLKQTILYNFGIPVHYYARVDFAGFETLINALGGVEIAVTCEFRGWQLISPDLDPEEADNWHVVTLEPGMYQMDGETALWYVRSRKLSLFGDFDRGRRQQQVLRAMLNQAIERGLISQVPTLWNLYRNSVDTDIDIGRMLQLAALAPAIRNNGILTLYLTGKTEAWSYPVGDGLEASAQLPIWEGPGMMQETFAHLYRPPALNRINRPPLTVEVVNATGNPEMALLAADNLAWYGFMPILSDVQPAPGTVAKTAVTYYGPNLKGAFSDLLAFVLNVPPEEISVNNNERIGANYRVILGSDYNSCIAGELFFRP